MSRLIDTHKDNKKRGILLRKTDLQKAVSFMLLTVHPVLRIKTDHIMNDDNAELYS